MWVRLKTVALAPFLLFALAALIVITRVGSIIEGERHV